MTLARPKFSGCHGREGDFEEETMRVTVREIMNEEAAHVTSGTSFTGATGIRRKRAALLIAGR